jgi:hypothetical protein
MKEWRKTVHNGRKAFDSFVVWDNLEILALVGNSTER